MAIQWFPGHMHLTRKAIAERVRQVDVVIELLDARLPGSSANPLLAELTGGKPGLKLLNKQDLANPVQTAAWLAEYNARPATRAIGMDASETAPARRLFDACRALAPGRRGLAKPLRILICGIPNVGKSTLVNTLAGGRKARTGDEAGITRLEQRIALADDVHLWDTPGMLWPRILIAESGFRLAASGAIGRNAFDEELVALELLRYAAERYAAALAARFELGALEAMRDEEILDAIGRRRGALLAGGRIDRQKSAEIVIDEFRSGRIGRMTLETPAEFARWQGEGERLEAQRQARKAARSRRKPEGERGHDETNTDSNAL